MAAYRKFQSEGYITVLAALRDTAGTPGILYSLNLHSTSV